MSVIGLWLALQDANIDNGCLWAFKGIHKQGLSRRFKRLAEGGVGFDAPAATYDLSQVGVSAFIESVMKVTAALTQTQSCLSWRARAGFIAGNQRLQVAAHLYASHASPFLLCLHKDDLLLLEILLLLPASRLCRLLLSTA